MLRPASIAVLALVLLLAAALTGRTQAAAPPPAAGDVERLVVGAESSMAAGDDRKAEDFLSRLPAGSLDVPRLARTQIVRAQICMKRHMPDAALRALPVTSRHVPDQAPAIELLRSQALFATGDAIGAVTALVVRERYLVSPPEIFANRDLIWNGLIAVPLPQAARDKIEQQDPITRGWLDLAWLVQQGTSPDSLREWAKRNSLHPAADRAAHIKTYRSPVAAAGAPPRGGAVAGTVATPTGGTTPGTAGVATPGAGSMIGTGALATMGAGPMPGTPVPAIPGAVPIPGTAVLATPGAVPIPGTAVLATPGAGLPEGAVAVPILPILGPVPSTAGAGSYALLLPLSGKLAASGRAVREGFISAWLSSHETRAPVRIYDVGTGGTQPSAAYQVAVQEGARLVVGPLTKESVAQVVAAGPLTVPMLALNYLDPGTTPGNLLQFGLAPEDEAQAAARQAVAQQRLRALVIAPGNDWGERAAGAFSAAYTAQGGQVLQGVRYSAGTQDFGKALRGLMHLDQSEARHRALTAALGESSEFEPRARVDADLVFAPARSADARALLPQLEFFRASNLPVYSVAAAWGGADDRELEGLSVCDMPWMLDASGPWAEARSAAGEVFDTEMRAQPRLFALGADAFRLAQALDRNALGAGVPLDAATGELRLEAGGRITRELGCGEIRNGRVATRSP